MLDFSSFSVALQGKNTQYMYVFDIFARNQISCNKKTVFSKKCSGAFSWHFAQP
jgi:hypothetical protein